MLRMKPLQNILKNDGFYFDWQYYSICGFQIISNQASYRNGCCNIPLNIWQQFENVTVDTSLIRVLSYAFT